MQYQLKADEAKEKHHLAWDIVLMCCCQIQNWNKQEYMEISEENFYFWSEIARSVRESTNEYRQFSKGSG